MGAVFEDREISDKDRIEYIGYYFVKYISLQFTFSLALRSTLNSSDVHVSHSIKIRKFSKFPREESNVVKIVEEDLAYQLRL